jgi:hypothetical protein
VRSLIHSYVSKDSKALRHVKFFLIILLQSHSFIALLLNMHVPKLNVNT